MNRACHICQADISYRDVQAKYCGKACSQKAYVQNNKARVKELKAASYQRNRKNHQDKRQEWYQANRGEISLRGKQARAAAMALISTIGVA